MAGDQNTEIQREQLLTHLQWEVEQPLLCQGVGWSWIQMSLLPKAGYWGVGSSGKLAPELPAMTAVQMPARHTNREQAGFQCKTAWQASFPQKPAWASSEIHWHWHILAEHVGPPGRMSSLCTVWKWDQLLQQWDDSKRGILWSVWTSQLEQQIQEKQTRKGKGLLRRKGQLFSFVNADVDLFCLHTW